MVQVKILYCTSWSYKGNFLQLKKYIETSAPEVDVTGGEYPVGTIKKVAAQIVSIAQMGFIGFVVAGESLFQNVL